MIKLIVVILITVWQPAGKVIYFYHTELKLIPRNRWASAIWAYRFDLLQKGFLGLFTRHYHKKWTKKQEQRELRRPGIVRNINIAVNE